MTKSKIEKERDWLQRMKPDEPSPPLEKVSVRVDVDLDVDYNNHYDETVVPFDKLIEAKQALAAKVLALHGPEVSSPLDVFVGTMHATYDGGEANVFVYTNLTVPNPNLIAETKQYEKRMTEYRKNLAKWEKDVALCEAGEKARLEEELKKVERLQKEITKKLKALEDGSRK